MNDDKNISYFPPHKVDLNDWEKKIEQRDHTVFHYDKNGKLFAVNYKKFAYYSSLILSEKMVDEKRLKDAAELLHNVKKPSIVNHERKDQ